MDVLDTLLAHLKRIKVARLAHSFADELGLPWADLARRHSARLGGGRRWVSATKTGERLNLKRPSSTRPRPHRATAAGRGTGGLRRDRACDDGWHGLRAIDTELAAVQARVDALGL